VAGEPGRFQGPEGSGDDLAKRPPGFVFVLALQSRRSQVLFSGGKSLFPGFFRRGNRLGEPATFGISGVERAQESRLLASGKLAGFFGQANGLASITDFRLRAGGQEPGQVIERIRVIRP